jgi:hypothetical protein
MKIITLAGAAALVLSVAAPASAALIGFYDFEADLSTDTSGAGNDATTVGASVSHSAVGTGLGGGRAADFAGVGNATNQIVLPLDINHGVIGDMTMGAWIYSKGTINGMGKVLSHDNGGFDRTLGSDSRGTAPGFDWAAFTGAGVIDIDFPQNTLEWIFLAVRYDGSNTKLTVNGMTVSGPDTTDDGDLGLATLSIGTNPSFLAEAYEGLIDNVFVYDTALSDQELEAVRLNGGPVMPTIPLPLPAVLLASGLAGLALFRRREG